MVAAVIDAFGVGLLLGCGVIERANECACLAEFRTFNGPGEPEIKQLGGACAVEDHVAGFDVSVNQALGVGVANAFAQALEHRKGSGVFHGA